LFDKTGINLLPDQFRSPGCSPRTFYADFHPVRYMFVRPDPAFITPRYVHGGFFIFIRPRVRVLQYFCPWPRFSSIHLVGCYWSSSLCLGSAGFPSRVETPLNSGVSFFFFFWESLPRHIPANRLTSLRGLPFFPRLVDATCFPPC